MSLRYNLIDMERLYESKPSDVSLFIGGLSKETSIEEIISYVEQYTKVTYFHFPRHKVTGKPVGYAFVRVSDARAAQWLIQRTNKIGSRVVDIQQAIDKDEKEFYQQDLLKRKIFIAGIKHYVDFTHIERELSTFGALKIFYRIETSHKNRGLAFAEFFDPSPAERVVSQGLFVDGCQLRVSYFRPKPGNEPSNLMPMDKFQTSKEQDKQNSFELFKQNPYYFDSEDGSDGSYPRGSETLQGGEQVSTRPAPLEPGQTELESNYVFRVATQGLPTTTIKKISIQGASLILRSTSSNKTQRIRVGRPKISASTTNTTIINNQREFSLSNDQTASIGGFKKPPKASLQLAPIVEGQPPENQEAQKE